MAGSGLTTNSHDLLIHRHIFMKCAKREDEVYKGHFPGQAGRVDGMGECGTTKAGLARPLVNG